jgi:uncharacterized membrane protein YciS (DUF1049 family)
MRDFFGLTSKYIENVYEQMFFMNYACNWTITELYNLPVGLRRWFIDKTLKQKEMEREHAEKAQNKSHRPQR